MNVMMYQFELAFEQSSDYHNPLYIDARKMIPRIGICVIPVSNDQGDVKPFSKLRAANQIRPRCPSSDPNFKQYGQRIVVDNCKKLAAVMYRIAFQMQPKNRPSLVSYSRD